MEFFQYYKPFKTSPDGSVVVGAVRHNRELFRVEKHRSGGATVLALMPCFSRVYHPLDAEIQRALIDLWTADRLTRMHHKG